MVEAARISKHIPRCQCASGSAILIIDGSRCNAEGLIDTWNFCDNFAICVLLHSFLDVCSVSGKLDGSHLSYANMEMEVQMKSVGTITHIEPTVYSVADVSRRNCHVTSRLPLTYVILQQSVFRQKYVCCY
jgi:hypothetical protein